MWKTSPAFLHIYDFKEAFNPKRNKIWLHYNAEKKLAAFLNVFNQRPITGISSLTEIPIIYASRPALQARR